MAENMQWEYRVKTFGAVMRSPKDDALEASLNEWGEEGWEVVSVLGIESQYKVRVIAKRPLTVTVRRRRSLPE